MRPIVLLPILALSTTGCIGANGLPGLWYLQVAAGTESEGDVTCSENFTDASCPEGISVEGEFSFSEESTLSDRLLIVEIFDGRFGNKVLRIDGELVPAIEDKGRSMVFEWQKQADSTERVDHNDSSYFEAYSTVGTATNRLSLQISAKERGWIGEWTRSSDTTLTAEQTDVFDLADFSGVFPPTRNPFDSILVSDDGGTDDDTGFGGSGTVENTPEAECTGSTCKVSISQTSSWSAAVRAWQITNVGLEENGGFAGAETPAGLGSTAD
jgi:hypothetical protein